LNYNNWSYGDQVWTIDKYWVLFSCKHQGLNRTITKEIQPLFFVFYSLILLFNLILSDLYHIHILTFKFSELTESKAKVWFGWKEWSGNRYNRYKPIWINWWDLRQWNSKVFISSLDPISPNMAWWELLRRMDLNYSRSFSNFCRHSAMFWGYSFFFIVFAVI
jgi:hypothetical protein